MSELKAVIFDLDGTLLDNNEVHLKSWKEYLKSIGKEISDEDFKKNISGRTNQDAVEHIFNKKMDKQEAEKYYLEKEKIYRRMFSPHIKPVNGLIPLLQQLGKQDITMAIATSGIQVNIDFMFDHIPIKQYFKEVINSEHIKKNMGKPKPDIFLITAKKLGIDPKHCVVFEDSPAGVKAGKAAGMKVVAIMTTHSEEELKKADLVIKDFTDVDVEKLQSLLN